MNETCHVERFVAYEWVMSHMNESCHIWMSHVTYEWVMSHMNGSCHIWMSHVIHEWVMSHNQPCHIWMSRVTYGVASISRIDKILGLFCKRARLKRRYSAKETYNFIDPNDRSHPTGRYVACEWVMSHMNESCHTWMSHVTCEWVMSHMNESCHLSMSHVTYEWVMLHMNESCPYEWVMYIYICLYI